MHAIANQHVSVLWRRYLLSADDLSDGREQVSAEEEKRAPPAGESLIEAPEYLISFIQRLNRDQMESALRRSGLKLTSWRILSCLEERGAMSLLDLAELSVTERTVTSRLVDRLAAGRLVKKHPLPHDKRISMVTLTPEGRQLLDRSMAEIHRLRTHLFAGFSSDEYETLRALLKRLKVNAQIHI